MSTRKSLILLWIHALLFLAAFAVYAVSPEGVSYYPFGITQSLLLFGCALAFFFFAKENLFVHYTKLTGKNISLFAQYTFLMGVMAYSLITWFSAMP